MRPVLSDVSRILRVSHVSLALGLFYSLLHTHVATPGVPAWGPLLRPFRNVLLAMSAAIRAAAACSCHGRPSASVLAWVGWRAQMTAVDASHVSVLSALLLHPAMFAPKHGLCWVMCSCWQHG